MLVFIIVSYVFCEFGDIFILLLHQLFFYGSLICRFQIQVQHCMDLAAEDHQFNFWESSCDCPIKSACSAGIVSPALVVVLAVSVMHNDVCTVAFC